MTIPPATSLGFGLSDSDGNGEQDSSVAVRSVVTVDVYTVLANPAIQKCINSASHSSVKLFYPIGVTSSTCGTASGGSRSEDIRLSPGESNPDLWNRRNDFAGALPIHWS